MLPNRAKHYIFQIVVILTNTYVLELKNYVQISLLTLNEFNPFQPSVAFLYPLKATPGCNGLIKLISFCPS